MKIGDKLICKKTFRYNTCIYFIKNKLYEISYFDIESITINTEKQSNIDMNSIDFKLYKPNTDYYKFEEYFYTPQEIRKNKLKQLNKKYK